MSIQNQTPNFMGFGTSCKLMRFTREHAQTVLKDFLRQMDYKATIREFGEFSYGYNNPPQELLRLAEPTSRALHTVCITYDEDEFRVPSPDNTEEGAYYTDDIGDAYMTALSMWAAEQEHNIDIKLSPNNEDGTNDDEALIRPQKPN